MPMNLTILTSRHSKASAVALGEALNAGVFNPYQNERYRGTLGVAVYNMGCPGYGASHALNNTIQIADCINKIATFERLNFHNVRIVPYTHNKNTAQEWLNQDKIVVNRRSVTGKANEGLTYSTKNAPVFEDTPLDNRAVIWTRYINHDYELRAYLIKGKQPLIFKKVVNNGVWEFKKVNKPEQKLLDELTKASQAFDKMFCIAFDILHCRTGDYYFLEANSAPSLLVHYTILPTLATAIKDHLRTRS